MTGVVRPLVSLIWLIVIPVGAAIVFSTAEKSWLIQDTNRIYWWSAAAAVVWMAGAPFLVSLPVPQTPRVWLAGLVWGVVAGAAIANASLTLLNCAGDASPGQTVTV